LSQILPLDEYRKTFATEQTAASVSPNIKTGNDLDFETWILKPQ